MNWVNVISWLFKEMINNSYNKNDGKQETNNKNQDSNKKTNKLRQ